MSLNVATEVCPRCRCQRGNGTIKVLGSGGDYEDWPCPECRPADYDRALSGAYSDGGEDGEAD